MKTNLKTIRTPTRLSNPDATSWDTFSIKHLIPQAAGLCLDLGCGPGAKKDLTSMGYDYIGFDRFNVTAANIIGTADKLPFRPDSFDLVIAASSFEHFADPWSAASEIQRILKPNGLLVASLSFLEPYHGHSYFHMSHLGAHKLLTDCGLTVTHQEPFEWTGIEASIQMMFQFRLFRWLSMMIVRPVLALRKLMIRRMIAKSPHGEKKIRAEEFLDEEQFRFTAGIKIRAQKRE